MGKNVTIILLAISLFANGQNRYWNENSELIPWRLPLVSDLKNITYIDLDQDGDPDVLKTAVLGNIPILWIDDDDDMNRGDLEGDQDNDCLLVDRNNDGRFAGVGDLSIDWCDTNNDGVANIQLVATNGGFEKRGFFDWEADFMYIIDYDEKDGIHNFINWNTLLLQAWQHDGFSNFYSDYHGNTLFLKMHASSFRIDDTRYSWENPFIFYDYDKDGLSEMAIRLVDAPVFRPKVGEPNNPQFEGVDAERDVLFTKKVSWVSVAWDLDNDNGQSNEFDFDLSLRFVGDGFDYADQVHTFQNLEGLAAADTFFFDARWRHNKQLIYTDPKVAYSKIFNSGKWKSCWLTFDEDDDCNRWERVEFYEPRDLWQIGRTNKGLDNNNQADAVGDRGEFDEDNSGDGKLYISPLDGKLHLFGAEWGAWRIDPNAANYQGYGGLYPPAEKFERLAKDPAKWATVRYSDSDNNGFFDEIEYDFDGDKQFEERISLRELGIDDRGALIDTRNQDYRSMTKSFRNLVNSAWNRSQSIVATAEKMGVSTDWYAFWKSPRTLHERYQYGYWLSLYLYKDMCHKALLDGDLSLKKQLDRAFYSGKWNLNLTK